MSGQEWTTPQRPSSKLRAHASAPTCVCFPACTTPSVDMRFLQAPLLLNSIIYILANLRTLSSSDTYSTVLTCPGFLSFSLVLHTFFHICPRAYWSSQLSPSRSPSRFLPFFRYPYHLEGPQLARLLGAGASTCLKARVLVVMRSRRRTAEPAKQVWDQRLPGLQGGSACPDRHPATKLKAHPL